jgi:uncharacterized membrane protein YkoI
MKRCSIMTLIAIIALAAGALTINAAPKVQTGQGKRQSSKQTKLAREAKITMNEAREIALKRAPGTVESDELEREHKKLVYSFDIRNAEGSITEVQVSAITGKIVRVEHETKQQEQAEKRKEKRAKSGNNRKP